MPENITDAVLEAAELAAVKQLKTTDDYTVAITMYHMVLKSLSNGYSPEAVIKGLEATVRALRTASTEKQLSEMMMPGVQ